MNPISNIWNHPKTSAAGLLIAIITIAGVLLQQGVTLGNVGSGTVVTFVSALATALLGLLAKDPDGGSSTGSTAKLGAWALVALLLPLPFLSGCTGTNVAQDIPRRCWRRRMRRPSLPQRPASTRPQIC
jgi:hypothetical protein